ncbi:AraC family transcriptional regulator [Bacillus sp. FJAT-42376]|uniref:GyrI-like domain-containing protein n=1 Tax=Bacillus sp. FJAT-42376 TaxID=2014076 RepID=UPI000F503D0A|nr:GyrI-like domain-containing protein [Bacillus sp. FJAT-42376]AZB42058.1 AraC family transcriptional regulator [Bacillus sp. FJAT-42376]
MNYEKRKKSAFVLAGFSAAGKWDGEMVYPIPGLWEKAEEMIESKGAKRITGVCLPPRSDHYFYTCGLEMAEVDFHAVQGMTVHTFPEQDYLVFIHKGSADRIPGTYAEIWKTFDDEGYKLKKGAPEIEVVESCMFGKETDAEYEMEIWIPVE